MTFSENDPRLKNNTSEYDEYVAFCKENNMRPATEYEFYHFNKLFKFFKTKVNGTR